MDRYIGACVCGYVGVRVCRCLSDTGAWLHVHGRRGADESYGSSSHLMWPGESRKSKSDKPNETNPTPTHSKHQSPFDQALRVDKQTSVTAIKRKNYSQDPSKSIVLEAFAVEKSVRGVGLFWFLGLRDEKSVRGVGRNAPSRRSVSGRTRENLLAARFEEWVVLRGSFFGWGRDDAGGGGYVWMDGWMG